LFKKTFTIHSPTVCSGNYSKSTVQLFVQGIIHNPQSNCLFRESFKLHSPAVCSGNHTKSKIQLFIPGIIKIHNPAVLKNARIIAETYATCPTNHVLQIQELTVFVASSLSAALLCLHCDDR